jgi:outer membrane protein assembly factor BamB
LRLGCHAFTAAEWIAQTLGQVGSVVPAKTNDLRRDHYAAIRRSNPKETPVYSALIAPAQPERPLNRRSRFGGFVFSRYSARSCASAAQKRPDLRFDLLRVQRSVAASRTAHALHRQENGRGRLRSRRATGEGALGGSLRWGMLLAHAVRWVMTWLDAVIRVKDAEGTIPQRAPEPLWEQRVPAPWAAHLEVPVVAADGAVFVACGDGSNADVVLRVFEIATGRVRYSVTLPEPPTRDFATGLPLPLDDGGALLPVYFQDEELSVLRVAGDGSIAARHVIATAEDDFAVARAINASDSGVKLFLSPAVAAGKEAYVFSWAYRQVRVYWLQARSIATGRLLWEAPEWFLARAADVVLSQESRGGDFTLRARRSSDGVLLWSRDPSRHKDLPDTVLIGALQSAFVFADGLRRRRAEACRDEALIAALSDADAKMTDDAFHAAADAFERAHPLTEGDDVLAVDARSGTELWRANLPGEVIASAATDLHVLAVSLDEAGTARLHRWTASGEDLGVIELAVLGPRDDRAPRAAWPRIIAADSSVFVWCVGDTLACHSHTTGAVVWHARLDPGDGFRPRTLDRFAAGEAATKATRGVLLVRHTDRLSCYGARA